MLILKDIQKQYTAGDQVVQALRGVSLSFRKSEFVCILGPSGCGKTTLLNIIGGLDQYTSGDLIIDGRSTKDYSDGAWDVYRNRSIGFVFQSYNLIPHQSVLANVELAMTLSGVGKAERRRRAAAALEQVGLGDQLTKRPNQLSGGQMQRVAIARALVNNPEILLADEPTGALDSETSVQIMELLQEVAKDRLVIMVTHNPDLAQTYATRIVRLLDGQVSGDSNPLVLEDRREKGKKLRKKPMSLLTAMSLSARNLLTKKGRTFLTAFAGSIGIIGIALILSLANGIQSYIDQVQAETLSSYPITIQAEQVDTSAMLRSLMGVREQAAAAEPRDPDRIYSSAVMYELLHSMVNAEVQTNNLAAFKTFLDNGGGGIADLATIRYSYDFPFRFYTEDTDGHIIRCDVTSLIQNAMTQLYGGDYSSYFESMGGMYSRMTVWEELLPGRETPLAEQVVDQYDLLAGAWPQEKEELVLFVDRDNQVSDLMLYALGLISSEDMSESLEALMAGNASELSSQVLSWSYSELLGTKFRMILPAECYQPDAAGGYVDVSGTDTGLRYLYSSEDIGLGLRIVGIARPKEDSTSAGMVSGALGYLSSLTDYAISATAENEIVRAQRADEEIDALTGLPFRPEGADGFIRSEILASAKDYFAGLDQAERAQCYLDIMSQPSQDYLDQAVSAQLSQIDRSQLEAMLLDDYSGQMGMDSERVAAYLAGMDDDTLYAAVGEAMAEQVKAQYAAGVQAELGVLSEAQRSAALDAALAGDTGVQEFSDEQLVWMDENLLPARYSEADFDRNLSSLGYMDPAHPSSISLYAETFEDKDRLSKIIQAYNDGVDEEDQISYTDYVAMLMRGITNIINAISYVLIAFVAISLVVSSIMIGIITYISVLERTKEIGILRAIGASKQDVARVFNAETIIVGLAAGLIGILMTLLLCIPINHLVHRLTHISSINAALPPAAAVILVAISVILTFIAGLIPSRLASRKDPVTALRTE